jgi:hypothetical protein
MGLQHMKEIEIAQDFYDLTEAEQEKAPVSQPIRGQIVAICRKTGRPWGASFVCPWSHTAKRRLPRAWIAHRNHMDCLSQAEIL